MPAVVCPHCDERFRADAARTSVRCPNCDERVRVPRANHLPLYLAGGAGCFFVLLLAAGGATAWLMLSSKPAPVAQKQPEAKKVADPPRPPAARGSEDAVWVEAVPEAAPLGKDRPTLVLDAGGHTDAITRALFTPDGETLITLGKDKSVRSWDVRSGEPLGALRLPIGPGIQGGLRSAALSPDGSRLAVCSLPINDANEIPIFLIDLARGRVERILTGHGDVAIDLDFSRDGGRLVSASLDRTARVWDVRDGKQLAVLRGHGGHVVQARFSPDGSRVLTSCLDGFARTFTASGEPGLVLRAAERKGPTPAGVRAIAWSPDGERLVTASEDGLVRLWSKAGQMAREVDLSKESGTNVTIGCVTFSKAGDELLYGGSAFKGVVGVVEVATGRHRLRFDEHNNSVFDVAYSPDGRSAVSVGGNENDVYFWSTQDARVLRHIRPVGRGNFAVAWAADGSHVAFGNVNRGDHDARPLEKTFRLDEFGVGDAPAGNYLRAKRKSATVELRQPDFYTLEVLEKGREPGTFKSPHAREGIYSYTTLGEDRVLVGGAFAGHLIDVKQGKTARRFAAHSGQILALAVSPDGKRFVTASIDQTLCFWDPERERPLLSVFVAGREWIAWTPEGYYACSANGERLMGWQVNNGKDALASFHPAARFRRSLYDPEAVRLALAEGGVERARAKLGRDRAIDVGRVLPPEVRLVSPQADAKRPDGKFEVAAEATSVGGQAITSLRLLVDGRPYDGERGVRAVPAPKPGKVKASWKIDVPPGRHVLAVVAESAVSRGVSAPVAVSNALPRTAAPSLYVLAVGVSDYPRREMKLKYAASDTRLLVGALERNHNGAFAKVEARVLTDRQATKQGVVEGLRWLSSATTADDVVVVFLSGHGTRDEAGSFLFVPHDVDARDPLGSCVSGDALKRALGDLPGRVIAVFDACHSGAAAARPEGRTDDLARDLVTEDYGIVCLCSSLGSQFSLESDETQAGFFTRALADGLAGHADLNGDRVVHLSELEFFARLRVHQLSRGQQTPTTGRPASFASFPMARVR